MNRAQAIAELTIELQRVTAADETLALIQRALRNTGLSNASTITPQDMTALLQAIAAEGGAIQELAESLAIHGTDPRTPRTPRAA